MEFSNIQQRTFGSTNDLTAGSDEISKQNKLHFYLNWSEERLRRIKFGDRLMLTVKDQATKVNNVMKRRDWINIKEKKDVLEHRMKMEDYEEQHPFDDDSQDDSFCAYEEDDAIIRNHIKFVANMEKQKNNTHNIDDVLTKYLTPAMAEYWESQTFNEELEKKKLRNLKKFFMEKYYMVSQALNEDKLKGQLKRDTMDTMFLNRYLEKAIRSKFAVGDLAALIRNRTRSKSIAKKKDKALWEKTAEQIENYIKVKLDASMEKIYEAQRKERELEMNAKRYHLTLDPTNVQKSVKKTKKVQKFQIAQAKSPKRLAAGRFVPSSITPPPGKSKVRTQVREVLQTGRTNSIGTRSVTRSINRNPSRRKIMFSPPLAKFKPDTLAQFKPESTIDSTSTFRNTLSSSRQFIQDNYRMSNTLHRALGTRSTNELARPIFLL